MIVSRKAILKEFNEKIFDQGNFYLVREGLKIAYIENTSEGLNFSPCDENQRSIITESVSYTKATGKKAITKFVEMLPFNITIQYDLKGEKQ